MNIYTLNQWRQSIIFWHLALMLALLLAGSLALPATVKADAPTPSTAHNPQSVGSAQDRSATRNLQTAPEVLYYHHDATGNLIAMTDEAGQVVWRADMRPFGQGSANPPDHPLRFAGQPRETDIGAADGLYHLGARTYDPLTGRFLSPDPLPLATVKRENPQRFNRYSYALNNPYRFHDASGLAPVSWEEQQARVALRNFINFAEAKLGPNPSFSERVAAFSYGPIVPPDEIIDTNNQPIRNLAGQEVDLDWGARLAGLAVSRAMHIDYTVRQNPKALAATAKREARAIYFPAKKFWNAIDWIGERLGGKRQTGPIRPDDPNILGVDLLIDYIVYGGDLRNYFDPVQVPPKRPQK